ncbi:hypothetical protein LXL04_012863 [Taraxacum kok-saghyz]
MMATQIQPFSEIDPSKFEDINPAQFITFTLQNTLTNRRHLHFPLIRVAVLDSPTASYEGDLPVIAAIVVPRNRETDWTFCTESGHKQLLFKLGTVSRLILIGNIPPAQGPSIYKRRTIDPVKQELLENELIPLLLPLHPKSSPISDDGSPKTLFLMDDDDVAYRVTVSKFLGPVVGEFLVEDIELVGYDDRNKQLRRRLRFKRMPQVVQSQALLLPIIGYDEATTQTDLESLRKIEDATFEPDTEILVHHYLIPMVSGLSVAASNINMLVSPRALCLGVGGGVLLTFLDTHFAFEVTGLEADPVVLDVATKYFGFNKTGSMRLVIGDAIEMIQNFPPYKSSAYRHEFADTTNYPPAKFDIIFVDLDSSDARLGFCSPPREFVKKPVIEGLRSLLDDCGVVIINVFHLDEELYGTLVKELKENFHKVYKVNVENEDYFVVVATVSEAPPDEVENIFLKKLKAAIPETYMDSIVEL